MKLLARVLLFPLLAAAVMLGLSVPAAFASNGAQHFNAAGLDFPLGPAPAGTIPATCPFAADSSADLTFLSGNAVAYQGGNGINAEGTGQFTVTETDGTAFVYVGHAHVWANLTNFTLSFKGSGADGNLSVHIVGNKPHPNQLANVTCS